MLNDIFIVCITYGKNKFLTGERLSREFNIPQENIHIIDQKTNGDQNTNSVYEFSGYQAGLTRVLNGLKASSKDSCFKVIFLNDTVFESHLKIFSRKIFQELIKFEATNMQKAYFVGLKMNFKYSNSLQHDFEYITTYLFALCGSAEKFSSVRFYQSNFTPEIYLSEILPTQDSKYKECVNDWLHPKTLFKGWYKSSPWAPLDSSTILRKKISIYHEHTLPERLTPAGFKMIDISECASFSNKFLIRKYKFLDKIFVNIKKIYSRIFVLGKS